MTHYSFIAKGYRINYNTKLHAIHVKQNRIAFVFNFKGIEFDRPNYEVRNGA